jgi:hypothetical protein
MSKLITTANLANFDTAYERLIAAHTGLSDSDSEALNARLIITLINHIGDLDVLTEALAVAKQTAA